MLRKKSNTLISNTDMVYQAVALEAADIKLSRVRVGYTETAPAKRKSMIKRI